MKSCGYEYRSQCVWLKDDEGSDAWFREAHELILVGVRGIIPPPAPDMLLPSVIGAPPKKFRLAGKARRIDRAVFPQPVEKGSRSKGSRAGGLGRQRRSIKNASSHSLCRRRLLNNLAHTRTAGGPYRPASNPRRPPRQAVGARPDRCVSTVRSRFSQSTLRDNPDHLARAGRRPSVKAQGDSVLNQRSDEAFGLPGVVPPKPGPSIRHLTVTASRPAAESAPSRSTDD